MPVPKIKLTPEDLSITEHFYNQVSESIKSVFELTSRIDERVKVLTEKQNELDQKLAKAIENQANLHARVAMVESRDFVGLNKTVELLDKRISILESKLLNDKTGNNIEEMEAKIHQLEIKNEGLHLFKSGTEEKVKMIVDIAFKIGVGLLSAYLLWKFGLK